MRLYMYFYMVMGHSLMKQIKSFVYKYMQDSKRF